LETFGTGEEINRLSNQHDVIKSEMPGSSLVLAPVDLSKPLRILDSGTADGAVLSPKGRSRQGLKLEFLVTWIRDLAAATAPVEHQFVGTDITRDNFATYHVQDINQPWPEDWENSFDLVHQRLVLVCAGAAVQQVVDNLVALVKPGGYIQLIEATNDLLEDGGPGIQDFIAVVQGIFKSMGSSPNLGNDLAGLLQAAGCEDVGEHLVGTRLGVNHPDIQFAKQGIYSTTLGVRALSAFGKCRRNPRSVRLALTRMRSPPRWNYCAVCRANRGHARSSQDRDGYTGNRLPVARGMGP
jgi:hypothetical protein